MFKFYLSFLAIVSFAVALDDISAFVRAAIPVIIVIGALSAIYSLVAYVMHGQRQRARMRYMRERSIRTIYR